MIHVTQGLGAAYGLGGDGALTAYVDFYAAFVAWFNGNSTLTTLIVGGLVNTGAAPLQPFPYLECGQLQPLSKITADDLMATLLLTGYGTSGDQARAIVTATMEAMLGDDSGITVRDSFRFYQSGSVWIDCGCERIDNGRPSRGGRMPDGLPYFKYEEHMEFFLTRA